jgi:hypothetical protein
MDLLINIRYYGGTNIARALKQQASSTCSPEMAAKVVVRKVLGNHAGDEPRLTRLNALEGFETVHEGACSNCYAEHKIMFRRGRRIFCAGCAVRERMRFKQRRAA